LNLHSVFLRSRCILPDRLDPCRLPISDDWSIVEEIPALVFDTMIRQAGWHFMWLRGPSSRFGFGLTQKAAVRRALIRALYGIPKRFNAAELDAIQITQYPGFQIAYVTVQTIQIQPDASLSNIPEQSPHPAPAR
jgi:hypothetical protein